MDILVRQSNVCAMKGVRLVWRVIRRLVWETAMDNTTGLSAQMAYLLLVALAPGLLFLWHLLGLFGTDPAKLHKIFLVLKGFMPPDAKVQDILDSAVASVVVTGPSGMLANAGIILGIYFGTVFIATISRALSHTHGVQEDRNWWSKYIISFFLLFWFGIALFVCFSVVVFGETLAGMAEVNFQLAIPLQEWVAALNLPFTAVAQVLSRMTRKGDLERLSKGVYYRSRETAIGKSRPDPSKIQKLASVRKPFFPSGIAAANLLGFSTQSASRPEVATSAPSLPRKLVGSTTVIHARRPEAWSGLSEIDAALLDFLRQGGRTSELSPEETVRKTLVLLSEKGRFERLVKVSPSEPPRVQAILGALGEQLRKRPMTLLPLRTSLNPFSRFNFGMLAGLPSARRWQAKADRPK